MSCSQRLRAQIPSLVAGELGAARSWLLRRHIDRCPACQAQAESAQRLLSGLKALAVAPVSDALRTRTLEPIGACAGQEFGTAAADTHASLPIAPATGLAPLLAVWAVSKRSLLTIAVLIAVGAIGVVAADRLDLGRYLPIHHAPVREPLSIETDLRDRSGRVWHIRGNYSGTAMLAADGEIFGQWRWYFDPKKVEDVQVKVDGHVYHLQHYGRHNIKDSTGRLLGTVLLLPQNAQQVWRNDSPLFVVRPTLEDAKARRRRMASLLPSHDGVADMSRGELPQAPGNEGIYGSGTGVSTGVSTSSYEASGFDSKLALTWKLRGSGHVVITTSTDPMPIFNESTTSRTPRSPASSPSGSQTAKPALADQPLFEISLEGRKRHFTGYGKHIIADDRTGTVLTVEISPLGHSGFRRP
jgi:hypothetical protein